MTLIGKQTVGSGGSTSVTFSSIPQTYTDLKLVASTRSTATGSNYAPIRISFNGTAYTSSFSAKGLYGNGTNALSENWTQSDFYWAVGASATASTFSNDELYIPNYTSSNNKSMSVDMATENNATNALAYMLAGLWSNSAAITSITLTTASGSFDQYSSFYLYGISNSQNQATAVPYASGGDVITTDGVYWYHQFLYSGTFTPKKDLVCDYLVVAGGGAGGGQPANFNGGGGGGAGGYRTSIGGSPLSLIANYGYTATVGAGGAGVSASVGSNGVNSIFATITSTGGGGGDTEGAGTSPGTGGSGGGASGTGASGTATGAAGNTPSTTPSQGNNGGNGYGEWAGGGGGSSVAGSNASSGVAGNGGNGTLNSISGTATYYAGGGGGGRYSTGTYGTGGIGGGATAASGNGVNATPNTGGGGSGSSGTGGGTFTGGNGGSGIVVVRYAV